MYETGIKMFSDPIPHPPPKMAFHLILHFERAKDPPAPRVIILPNSSFHLYPTKPHTFSLYDCATQKAGLHKRGQRRSLMLKKWLPEAFVADFWVSWALPSLFSLMLLFLFVLQ